jgi:FPC/CPF motif-containing protein YcgG
MLYRLSTFPNESAATASRDAEQCALLSEDLWFYRAATQFTKMIVGQPCFPCNFALEAIQKGTLFASDIEQLSRLEASTLIADLSSFLSFYRSLPYRSALVIFADTRHSKSLDDDERSFWKILRFIQSTDQSKPIADYDKPEWRFHFLGEQLFFNGHSPHYEQRISRRSTMCLAIVIQTAFNLREISGESPYALSIASKIRRAVDGYDRISRSPLLGPNMHWRQFWLLDDNGSDDRACPLRV